MDEEREKFAEQVAVIGFVAVLCIFLAIGMLLGWGWAFMALGVFSLYTAYLIVVDWKKKYGK